MEKRKEGYDDLLASIRRLTVMVLDNLEAGSRDRTLDQGQKRLLSSTGTRLLSSGGLSCARARPRRLLMTLEE